MYNVKRLLQARGYWEAAAGDGAGGGQGGTGGGGAGGAAGDGQGGAGDGKGGQGGDGKTGKLSDTEAALLGEVMEKKGKIKELSTHLEQVNAQLEKLKGFEGLDLDAVKGLLAADADRKTKDLEAKGEWETLKQQMATAHQADAQALKDRIAALEADVKTASTGAAAKIAELTVGNAFGTSQYIAKEMNLPVSKVRTLYGEHFEFDGERVVAYDKPAGKDGRKALVDASGAPLGFDAALQKLVEVDPHKDTMLKSKAKPGSGSGTDDGAARPAAVGGELKGVNRLAAALAARAKK